MKKILYIILLIVAFLAGRNTAHGQTVDSLSLDSAIVQGANSISWGQNDFEGTITLSDGVSGAGSNETILSTSTPYTIISIVFGSYDFQSSLECDGHSILPSQAILEQINGGGSPYVYTWNDRIHCTGDLTYNPTTNGGAGYIIQYVPYDSRIQRINNDYFLSVTSSSTATFSHDEWLTIVALFLIILGIPFWRFIFGGWGKYS